MYIPDFLPPKSIHPFSIPGCLPSEKRTRLQIAKPNKSEIS